MAWTQTQPGLYTRPLGENEAFIKIIGDRGQALGREHWSITSKARFSLLHPLTDDELERAGQKAWRSVRFEHPSIATLAGGEGLTYEVPREDEVETWVKETFCIHGREVLMDDLLAGFQPSKYATAHLLLGEPAVVLHLSHWRTDGYGALLLLDAFLRHLSAAVASAPRLEQQWAWGEEVARLVPSVEEVLQLPHEPTPEMQQVALTYLATAALFHGSTGLAASGEEKKAATLPRGTRGVVAEFTSEETSVISAACLAKSITIEAAVQASCAAATYASATAADSDKPYTSTIRLNLRPHMPAPYDGPAFAAALCTGGYMEQVPASQSWTENALQFTRAYARGATEDFLQSRRAYAQTCLNALKQVPPPQQPASSAIDISSVGDASELAQAQYVDGAGQAVLDVDGVSVGVETLTRQVYCFLSIFRSRLQLYLVYNEAFYGKEQMEKVVGDVKDVLWKNVGWG